jgi:hypothetical protein
MSARALRAEVGARNLQRAVAVEHEVTFGDVPSVVYAAGQEGGHGNFLPASFRRILADPGWAARLEKTYTASARLPRAGDRWRGELECAGSSDALLMNVFCYPGVLRRTAVCGALGVEAGLRPEFGVRAGLPMRKGEVDRTELDMVVGDLLVEAKLTEGGFGRASTDRLTRYERVEEVFEMEELPRVGGHFAGYQIVRGVLAAVQTGGRYLVLLDGRRTDLLEVCFRVLRAVRDAEARSRFRLLSWQELSATLPRAVQVYLAEKYGILGT